MKKFLIYGFSEDEIIKMKNLVKFVSQNIKYITILDEDFEKKLLDVIENEKFENATFTFDCIKMKTDI